MHAAEYLLMVGLLLMFLCVMFRPLELAFPATPGQKLLRPAWRTDLCFFLGQYLLWNAPVFWLLGRLDLWMAARIPLGFRESVAGQPWWLQAVEAVFLSDLSIYWGHRLQHRVGLLWRFHSVHHSAAHLDWLAPHRRPPFDYTYTEAMGNSPV